MMNEGGIFMMVEVSDVFVFCEEVSALEVQYRLMLCLNQRFYLFHETRLRISPFLLIRRSLWSSLSTVVTFYFWVTSTDNDASWF
jgi:hypothetical protein